MATSPEKSSWLSMIQRCTNPAAISYPSYGGRGIKVHPRWFDFREFLQDMGKRPSGTSLNRIDNDGDYGPLNCNWATPKEQHRNRRDNLRLTLQGRTQVLSDWCDELSLPRDLVYDRLRDGWSPERALTVGNLRGHRPARPRSYRSSQRSTLRTITNDQVQLIKSLREKGVTLNSLAMLFLISESHVSRICRGLRRKEISK